ncbi:MAG TPA: hypothetical protein VFY93_08580 [Planctomycetota bacterium]|nr:hypothetical protein [Planctomycetota bacterium]
MGLFEWLGESFNPGPVGDVQVGARERRSSPPGAVIVCAVISSALLGVWIHVLFATRHGGLVGAAGTLVYLALAYFLHPAPDCSNLGWLGGRMDHPSRYSDDLNRFLLFLVAFLWPARFIAESFVAAAGLLARDRHP